MRILVRVGVLVVIVFVLAIGALLVFLPRFANSPAVRERIEQAAYDALGREVGYTDLTFALIPPRLVVREPRVAGEKEGDAPLLEARGVALELALGPLLARQVVIDSLVVDSATVRLTRTEDGFALPEAPDSGDDAEASEAEEAEAEEVAFALQLNDARLRGGTIVLEDQTVEPATTLSLRAVEVDAAFDGSSIPFDFKGELETGGALEASGKAGDVLDAEATLSDIATKPLAAYLGDLGSMSGLVNGTLLIRGKGFAADAIDADLVVNESDVQVGEISVRGKIPVSAQLKVVEEGFTGPFDLNMTDADLQYGQSFRKPAGTQGSTTGDVTIDKNFRWDVENFHLQIHNMDAKGSVRGGARTRAQLEAPPFDLEGWDDLVPALEELSPRGGLSLEGFKVATDPLEFAGDIGVREVQVSLPDRAPVTAKGRMVGAGRDLRLTDMTLSAAGQTLQVSGDVGHFDADARFAVTVTGREADTERLLAAFTPVRDTLYGKLDLDADLSGPIGGDQPIHDALRGRAKFEITEGRVKSVSLLEGTFDSMGSLGQVALAYGKIKGGSTLQRFYEDEFESAGGTFQIASGLARTNDLRLVYRHYTVDMRGGIRLVDQSFDNMRAILTISEEVDEAVHEGEGVAGREQVIEIGIEGTVSDPRPVITVAEAQRFLTNRVVSKRRNELEEKLSERVDEYLGEGAGKEILDGPAQDILDGLLGGGQRR